MAEKKSKMGSISLVAFARALDKAYGSWSHLAARSFVSGVFVGLGATIGFAAVVIIIGYLLSALGYLPIVGDFFTRLNEFINSATPNI
ncbi:hypothetical protein A2V68_02410 [candidate division Kazan bacterium RBG_13_50_9]|uniref:Uncharacterized protein n=1 Tax=candidate division Kazan bacterium RBG_13_50_9 TaxID=1798535 RepID=A0A1F4NT44_UNCK3|nr:MAG: hypothetical protein A2V68_02410 [candidate division Kazan bacterium RBG_13_50_9]